MRSGYQHKNWARRTVFEFHSMPMSFSFTQRQASMPIPASAKGYQQGRISFLTVTTAAGNGLHGTRSFHRET